MKCLACNKTLNDYEATRKTASGEFLDMCSGCVSQADEGIYPLSTRLDLKHECDIELEIYLTEDQDVIQ